MLLEFRVENYRSIRTEQALSLEAGRSGRGDDERLRNIQQNSDPILPVAAIYGPNASGKSNVLSAIAFMRSAVLQSHRKWDPEGGIPRNPFAWGHSRDLPSLFEVTLVVDNTKFAYGFVVDDECVQEEWLFAWPNRRKQVWYTRDRQVFKFGDSLKGPVEAIVGVTRPNALFLSSAVQLGHRDLRSIYAWFRKISSVNVDKRNDAEVTIHRALRTLFTQDTNQKRLFADPERDRFLELRIRELLKWADIGIVDIKLSSEPRNLGMTSRRSRLLLKHQDGDDDSWLAFEEESEGTKTLLRLAYPVFESLQSSGLLLVDELESSLHPLIGLAIVRLFNGLETNDKHAQLVFTTHDTNLLGTTVGEQQLRRDQIWFTEKDDSGATNLYPLTDYRPRKVENLERGYLQGRYGAVPFLGDLHARPS